jgi:hypothetical protein
MIDLLSSQISEVVRNYAIVAGGAFGLYLAWLRVTASNRQAESQLRQTELARRVHVSELFNRAVGQLKDRKLEVRLGAILTLEQICNDYPDLSSPTIRLLTTHLRENAVKYGDRKPPADVQAIMELLKGRLK